MQTLYRMPDDTAAAVEQLRSEIERFRGGVSTPEQFKAFRVPFGIYEQRRSGSFMMRVRLPAGGILPSQMRALAAVSRRRGNGTLHVTTRQDMQIHDVALDGVHPAAVELLGAGLSTRGGGGNTVRNVTACPHAGVCAREVFDVGPHAVAMTEFLLPDPLSYRLPRKLKIALSGCARDCAGARVNDAGFIAKAKDGRQGFAVYAGGGMGARSRTADLIEEFVEAGEVHLAAEAIKRVFDKQGDRKNRHRARLRFLVERIGPAAFRGLYVAEFSRLKAEAPAGPELRGADVPQRGPAAIAAVPAEGFERWRRVNVVAQKQEGFFVVYVPLPLGDIHADALEKLADVAEANGEGIVRATQTQNLAMRWVREDELRAVHGRLSALGLARTPAPIVREMTACAGASTCRLGICLSRGLAQAISDALNRSGLDLDGPSIRISGCPNACGRHPLAAIGLFGVARRCSGRLVPHYVVQFGGRSDERGMRLAAGKDAIPARNVPAFVVELLRTFQASPQYPDFHAFLDSGGTDAMKVVAARLRRVPSFEEDRNYYSDWGAEQSFSVAGRGPGECGAGVFDLIEVDLASARQALEEGRTWDGAALASRALLVTQGLDAKDDGHALALFREHFVEAGHVSETFGPLILECAAACGTPDRNDALAERQGDAVALLAAVKDLYDRLGSSLRIERRAESAPGNLCACCGGVKPDREEDFRGLACPLNYAKTTMALDEMPKGQVLSVLLDAEGARNVPKSAEKDGNDVLCVSPDGEHWRVLIRKR